MPLMHARQSDSNHSLLSKKTPKKNPDATEILVSEHCDISTPIPDENNARKGGSKAIRFALAALGGGSALGLAGYLSGLFAGENNRASPANQSWQGGDSDVENFDFETTEIAQILTDIVDEDRARQTFDLAGKKAKADAIATFSSLFRIPSNLSNSDVIASTPLASRLLVSSHQSNTTIMHPYIRSSPNFEMGGEYMHEFVDIYEDGIDKTLPGADVVSSNILPPQVRKTRTHSYRVIDDILFHVMNTGRLIDEELDKPGGGNVFDESKLDSPLFISKVFFKKISPTLRSIGLKEPRSSNGDVLNDDVEIFQYLVYEIITILDQITNDSSAVRGTEYHAGLLMLGKLWQAADLLTDANGIARIDAFKERLLLIKHQKMADIRKPNSNVSVDAYLGKVFPNLRKQGINSSDKILIHILKKNIYHVYQYSVEEVLSGKHLAQMENATSSVSHFRGDNCGLSDPDLNLLLRSVNIKRFVEALTNDYFDQELKRFSTTPLYFDAENLIDTFSDDGTSLLSKDNLEAHLIQARNGYQKALMFSVGADRRLTHFCSENADLLKRSGLNAEQILQADYIYEYIGEDKQAKREIARLAEVLNDDNNIDGLIISSRKNVSVLFPIEFPSDLINKLRKLAPEMQKLGEEATLVNKALNNLEKLTKRVPSLHQLLIDKLKSITAHHLLTGVKLSDEFEITYSKENLRLGGNKGPGAGPHRLTIAEILLGMERRMNPGRYYYSQRKIVAVPAYVQESQIGSYLAMLVEILDADFQSEFMDLMERQRSATGGRESFEQYVKSIIPPAIAESSQWLTIDKAPFLLVGSEKSLTTMGKPSQATRKNILGLRTGPIGVISLVNRAFMQFPTPQDFRYQMYMNETLRQFVETHYQVGTKFDVAELGLKPIQDHYGDVIDWNKLNIDAFMKSSAEGMGTGLSLALKDLTLVLAAFGAFMGPSVGIIFALIADLAPTLVALTVADTQEEKEKLGGEAVIGVHQSLFASGVDAYLMKGFGKMLTKYNLPADAGRYKFLRVIVDVVEGQVLQPGNIVMDSWSDACFRISDESDDTRDIFLKLLLSPVGGDQDIRFLPLLDNNIPISSNGSYPVQPLSESWCRTATEYHPELMTALFKMSTFQYLKDLC